MPCTIRPARADEADLLSDLAFRSKRAWGYDDLFMEACREELHVTPESIGICPTFVAESGGEIVGFYQLEDDALSAMFVEPERMRSGVGRALCAHLTALARARRLAAVVIQSDPNAQGFYEAMGAERIGETPSASIPGRLLPLLRLSL